MSLAAERIQKILQEIDSDTVVAPSKTAWEVAEILLQEQPASSAIQQECPADNSVGQGGETVTVIHSGPIYDVHSMETKLRDANARWVVRYYRHFPRSGGRLEKIKIFVKRVIRKLVKFLIEPITHEVQEFHIAVVHTLNAMRNNDVVFDSHIRAIEQANAQRDNQLQTVMGTLNEYAQTAQAVREKSGEYDLRIESIEHNVTQRENKIDELTGSLNEYERVVQNLSEQIEMLNVQCQQNQAINELFQKLAAHADELNAQEQAIDLLRKKFDAFEKDQKDKEEEQNQDYLNIDYFEFEDAFRGSRTQIKEAQKMYLRHFTECKHVLDLGSGRGEFLDLLHENRIPVVGVDTYAPFVDFCRMHGHTVVCEDAIEYLRHQKDASVDGIFAAQLVEHLSTQNLLDLCKESYRVLESGKTMVIETPNPLSLSIYMNSFYLDPTHTKPVHPKTLEYFLKNAGFRNVEVVFTNQSKVNYRFPLLNAPAENLAEFNDGVNFMSDIIFGSQDYAIIAVK